MKAVLLRLLTAVLDCGGGALCLAKRNGRRACHLPKRHAGRAPATIERGNLKEEIFTNRATIDAVKVASHASGTVITLVDYRDGSFSDTW